MALSTCGLVLALMSLALPAAAQPLRLYSEFRRVGANNEIVKQDAVGEPREILSPAVLRGMYLSYRIVVATPPGMTYWMYIGANPDKVLDTVLYREKIEGGIPTALEEVKLPVTGMLSAERKADTYWLDVYVPPGTPTHRMRIEAQLNFDNAWAIYPLEVRVLEGELMRAAADEPASAPASANSADTALGAFQQTLCATTAPKRKPAGAVAAPLQEASQSAFLARNALQDLTLVRSAEARASHEAVVKGLLNAFGAPDTKTFCAAIRKPYNPDLILRARDFLIRTITPPQQ